MARTPEYSSPDLETHLEKVQDAAAKLHELEQQMKAGSITTELLQQLGDQYIHYVKLRTERIGPPTLNDRINGFLDRIIT